MKRIVLKADKRDSVGKQAAKQYRRQDRVPGVFYGFGEEATRMVIERKKLLGILSRSDAASVMIDIRVGDERKQSQTVIIREVQRDPVTGEVLHVDFQRVSMDRAIHLEIPIQLSGTAVGVTMKGGILEHLLREIEINCLPADIPERIVLDIKDLDIGDSIHVSDITIPKAEILTDPDRVMVTVVPPVVIKEVEEVPEEEVEVAEEEAEEAAAREAEGGPEEEER